MNEQQTLPLAEKLGFSEFKSTVLGAWTEDQTTVGVLYNHFPDSLFDDGEDRVGIMAVLYRNGQHRVISTLLPVSQRGDLEELLTVDGSYVFHHEHRVKIEEYIPNFNLVAIEQMILESVSQLNLRNSDGETFQLEHYSPGLLARKRGIEFSSSGQTKSLEAKWKRMEVYLHILVVKELPLPGRKFLPMVQGKYGVFELSGTLS
jgi:hypothetical protein